MDISIKWRIVEGNPNYIGYATDVWQIGLVILYILCGHQPYQATEEDKKRWFLHRWWYNTKLLKDGQYHICSDKNVGEIWLHNYLIQLYAKERISDHLLDLLLKILTFDPRRRLNIEQIVNHKWLNEC